MNIDQKTPDNSGNNKKQANRQITTMKGLQIAVEFGFIIALPLLLCISIGKWLDQKYQTEFIVYIGIIIALTSSSIWLYRKMVSLMEDFNQK